VTGHVTFRLFTDADGNPVREVNNYATRIHWWSVNGDIHAQDVGADRATYMDDGGIVIIIIGSVQSFSIPGRGRVYSDVGRSMLVIDANGTVSEYAGGYDDWLKRREVGAPPGTGATPTPPERPRQRREGPRKLSFKERRELSELPGRIRDAEAEISALEAERDDLQRSMADPSFYRRDGARVALGRARLEEVQSGIEEAYRTWESLESTLRELESIERRRII